MKKYIIKLNSKKIFEYLFCFIAILIIEYFTDGQKLTKENITTSIIFIAVIIVFDLIVFLIRKNKKKYIFNIFKKCFYKHFFG